MEAAAFDPSTPSSNHDPRRPTAGKSGNEQFSATSLSVRHCGFVRSNRMEIPAAQRCSRRSRPLSLFTRAHKLSRRREKGVKEGDRDEMRAMRSQTLPPFLPHDALPNFEPPHRTPCPPSARSPLSPSASPSVSPLIFLPHCVQDDIRVQRGLAVRRLVGRSVGRSLGWTTTAQQTFAVRWRLCSRSRRSRSSVQSHNSSFLLNKAASSRAEGAL